MSGALHIAIYVLAAVGALTVARHAPVVHHQIAAKKHAATMRRIISLELATGVGLSADTREWIDAQPTRTEDEMFVMSGKWWCYGCDAWHEANGGGFDRKLCRKALDAAREGVA